MNERGMQKWAPYKSLEQQEDYLHMLLRNREKVEKPILSEERAKEIDYALSHFQGQEVLLSYYEDGFIYERRGTIGVVDILKRSLFLDDTEIPFKALLRIEKEDSFSFEGE